MPNKDFDLKKYLAQSAPIESAAEFKEFMNKQDDGLGAYLKETEAVGSDVLSKQVTDREITMLVLNVMAQAMSDEMGRIMNENSESPMAMMEVMNLIRLAGDNTHTIMGFIESAVKLALGIAVQEEWLTGGAGPEVHVSDL